MDWSTAISVLLTSIHHFVTLSILNRVVSALLFICLSEKRYGCTMDHSVMHASTCWWPLLYHLYTQRFLRILLPWTQTPSGKFRVFSFKTLWSGTCAFRTSGGIQCIIAPWTSACIDERRLPHPLPCSLHTPRLWLIIPVALSLSFLWVLGYREICPLGKIHPS